MSRQTSTQNSITAGRIAVGLLVVLIIVFAVLNSQSVRMHWIVATDGHAALRDPRALRLHRAGDRLHRGRRPRGRE